MKYSQLYLDDLDKAAGKVPQSHLQGKRICITGATGLIGSSIVDILLYLKERYGSSVEIYLAGRNEEKIKARFSPFSRAFHAINFVGGQPFTADIPFDYLIHCAENAHPQAYSQYPVETAITSVYGTNELLSYMKEHGGRFCYLSSSEVYGGLNATAPIKENEFGFVNLSDARSCYPSSKRMNETLCACYKKEYGVDSVIVRPGHIYGGAFTREDSRAFAQFARDVLSGRDIVMKSEGLQFRSYCYSLDCASAILAVLLCGESGEAYNISNSHSLATIRELAETFARLSGRKVVFDLPTQAESAGYNRMTYSALDSSKLEALGWEGAFTLEAGVFGTLQTAEL